MRAGAIRRIFVAGQGVLARRVVRVARAAGIETVVLIREVDAEAAWPEDADYAAYLPGSDQPDWPAPSALVMAAIDAGCDAIHPGWGWLARSASLAEHAAASGLAMMGPGATDLSAIADRGALRRLAQSLQIPTVPGSEPIDDAGVAETWLAWTGSPAMVKPLDGNSALGAALLTGSDRGPLLERLARGAVLLERYVVGAREIEVPVVGNGVGGAMALGTTDITARADLTRLLAEAPAVLSDAVDAQIRASTEALCARMSWSGLGSARYLLASDGRAYFLQFRPGLQPWHVALEGLLGVDLVDLQLRVVLGEPLLWSRDGLQLTGHAVCARVVAESSGQLSQVGWPADGRVQGALAVGDPVLVGDEVGALSVQAPTRPAALVRLKAALDGVRIDGARTSIPRILRLFDSPSFFQAPMDRDAATALLAPDAPGGPVDSTTSTP